MHLRGGELDGVRIISQRAARQMQQITAHGQRYDLGLGWFRPAKMRTTGNATKYVLETITQAELRVVHTRVTGADQLVHHV